MKFLSVFCIILIIADAASIPLKYMHDRVARPAWKKSYAMRFALASLIVDILLSISIIYLIRSVW